METCTHILLSSCVLVISCIIYYVGYFGNITKLKPELDLAVCILSARDHFDLRDAVRSTWMRDLYKPIGFENMSLLAKFVIGSEPCPIHPDYRISPYGCQPWNPQLPANPTKELATFTSLVGSSEKKGRCYAKSVTFLVIHPVLLKRVGIHELFPFDHSSSDVQAIIEDTVTGEELSRTRFTPSHTGGLSQGYKYRPVAGLILPKGTLLFVGQSQSPEP